MKKKIASKAARRAADGRFVLGRGAFQKISAVEGIRFSTGLKKTLRELDRQGMTGPERRRVLAGKYGKTSG